MASILTERTNKGRKKGRRERKKEIKERKKGCKCGLHAENNCYFASPLPPPNNNNKSVKGVRKKWQVFDRKGRMKEGKKKARRERKEEGGKDRRKERRNVNVFFMLEKKIVVPSPPFPNYKFAKGARKKWQVFRQKREKEGREKRKVGKKRGRRERRKKKVYGQI